MTEFIPYNKMNKNQRNAYNKQQRVEWGFKPITRVKPSAKLYDRKKVKYCE